MFLHDLPVLLMLAEGTALYAEVQLCFSWMIVDRAIRTNWGASIHTPAEPSNILVSSTLVSLQNINQKPPSPSCPQPGPQLPTAYTLPTALKQSLIKISLSSIEVWDLTPDLSPEMLEQNKTKLVTQYLCTTGITVLLPSCFYSSTLKISVDVLLQSSNL